eukprot:m.108945 g.108945  ORF g.108945 m.108945 type:complete len:142 (+) comp27918_c0_seq1:284-709(+)
MIAVVEPQMAATSGSSKGTKLAGYAALKGKPSNSKAGKFGKHSKKNALPNPRAEIVRLTEKRELLQHELEDLELQIYNYEGTYLRESPYGNAVRGWRTQRAGEKSMEVDEEERLFSTSSKTWEKKLAQSHQNDKSANNTKT